MGRSFAFNRHLRNLQIAFESDRLGISVEEMMERAAMEQDRRTTRSLTRREFASFGSAIGAGIVTATMAPRRIQAAPSQASVDVGIVGAGLAGLVCATELKRSGIAATIYEGSGRVGGRCWSLSGLSPNQVCERGGELIDNLHKTMIAYAREFGLTLEDVGKVTGDVHYFFDGSKYPETDVVREYREFVATMRVDLTRLSGGPTAFQSNDFDKAIDKTSLQEYLEGKNGTGKACPPIAKAAILEAYKAEYGLDPSQQSSLNFLMFIHADKRSRFQPWGVFSDERYHIIGGNDGVVKGLAAKLTGQIQLGQVLVKIAKTASGKIELTFKSGAKTVTKVHDHVVITVPFSVLRGIELAPTLGLSSEKINAIKQFGYGTNAKMMVAFRAKPWTSIGCNGATYSNLTNHQATWETNPSSATANSAIITDYASAARGLRLLSKNTQMEAMRWLSDFEKIVPGVVEAAVTETGGTIKAHMEPWPNSPWALGSYSCYRPGQFTTIAGLEGQAAGNLHFAGEHTNSFYEWQGFMEGACLSGIAAAKEVLAK